MAQGNCFELKRTRSRLEGLLINEKRPRCGTSLILEWNDITSLLLR